MGRSSKQNMKGGETEDSDLLIFPFQICKTPYSNIGTMIISTTFVGLVAWFYHLLTFKQKQLGRPEDRQTDSTETDIKMQYMAL